MDTLSLTETPLAGTYATVSVSGEEAVNELFELRVTFLVPQGDHTLGGRDAIERTLLGARVTLSLGEAPASQRRTGIVADARALALQMTDEGPRVPVIARVVPTAWLLTQRKKSRIFQRMYPHEIVSRVLSEAGVRHRWALTNKYPRRIYCTQYDETDWAFVTRLLAEEGALFFFEHPRDFAPGVSAGGGGGDDTRATVAGVLRGAGAAATKIGAMADVGYLTMGGGALGVLGDLVAEPEADEEAPEPREGGVGAAGPPGMGDVMVMVDQAEHYAVGAKSDEHPDSALGLWLRREGEMVAGDAYVATEFDPHASVRPDEVESRDYDFRRPLMQLRASTRDRDAKLAVDGEARPLEVYEHDGQYETTDVTVENARNHLEQHRARAMLFRGVGVCPRVLPGHTFELHNGTGDPVEEGRYVPVRAVHHALNPAALGASSGDPLEGLVRGAALAIHHATRGGDPASAASEAELQELIRAAAGALRPNQPVPYRCVFECVRADVPARPRRPAREPRHVTETATVVGPRGEDIYTDRYGRVRVQFHWDRSGKWDEQSSCWVRVAQPWAGAGYGFQFVPRVGMEVLVTFLRGDPDRPVITGALYNATHETPEPLPQRSTRSAIRTQSSPGGGGFNELAFEDQAGTERVLLRAQKDLELVVNDHHARSVRGGETVTVGGAQSVGVGEQQRTLVGEHQSTLVGGSQSASVRGDRTSHVARNEAAWVDGGRYEHVAGASASAVDGDVTAGVNGSRVTVVHGDDRVIVGKDESSPRLHHVRVEGTAVTVGHKVQLHAVESDSDDNRFIGLYCGDSSIEINKDSIVLRSKSIFMRGADEVVSMGADATLSLDDRGLTATGDPIELNTLHGASLVLKGAQAGLHGSRIHLEPENAPPSENPGARAETTPNVRLRFTHGFLPGEAPTLEMDPAGGPSRAGTRTREPKPIADVRVKVSSVTSPDLRTDADGRLSCYAPDYVKTFTVQLYAREKYPDVYGAEDDPLTFLVKMVDEVEPSNALSGARLRLRNLGYEPGPDLDAEALDPSTEAALLDLQFDRDLARSGRPDAATAAELKKLWGG